MRIFLYTETTLPKIGGHEMAVDALYEELLAYRKLRNSA